MKKLKGLGFLSGILIAMFLGMLFFPAYGVATSLFGGRNIQSLSGANGQHAELLKKHNLADINFIVVIDGERVYQTADLMPYPDHIYRETLLWDETGRVAVLELMGKRVFAYDAQEKRRLGKGELDGYKFFPMPGDYVYIDLKDIDE